MEIKNSNQIVNHQYTSSEDILAFSERRWVAIDDMIKELNHIKIHYGFQSNSPIHKLILSLKQEKVPK